MVPWASTLEWQTDWLASSAAGPTGPTRGL